MRAVSPIALTLAGLLALPCAAQTAGAPALAVTQVAPGVYVHRGEQQAWLEARATDVANMGFIVGDRCVAVVDSSGSPAIGQRLQAVVAQTTAVPVCYLIITHAHPDHALGIGAFAAQGAPRPEFVAHARFAAALAARWRGWSHALQRDAGIELSQADLAPPGLPVQDSIELDLGGRKLAVRAWPTGHTDNDLTVMDLQTRSLFLGDMVFVGHMPVLDGKLKGWLANMDVLRGMNVALAIPGHGAPSTDWPAMLAPQQAYLLALQRDVRAAIKERRSLSQTVQDAVWPANSPWLLGEQFHRRNLTAAYAELEWED